MAAFVDDVGVAVEDGDGELVLAQIFPDVLDRIELWRIGRQVQKGDVVGDAEVVGDVPAGAVENEDGVRSRRDLAADLGQMQGERFGVGPGQDQRRGGGARRADRAEDVSPFVTPVARAARSASTPGPYPGQRSLLADAGFVLEPDLDRLAARGGWDCGGDPVGEVFLNAAWAASSAFG